MDKSGYSGLFGTKKECEARETKRLAKTREIELRYSRKVFQVYDKYAALGDEAFADRLIEARRDIEREVWS